MVVEKKEVESIEYTGEHGQDKYMAEEVFMGVEHGVFVDVGAYDGNRWSNTHYFAKNGWSGLMIEPNPSSYRKCVKLYENYPHVECVNLAITDKSGSMRMAMEGSTSSIRDTGEIGVHVETLQVVLDLHEIRNIDLLDIDCEGQELNVLKSFDIERHSPYAILIEMTKQKEIIEYMNKHNYVRVESFGCDNLFLHRGGSDG